MTSLVKPDFAHKGRSFLFGPEHDELRESITAWVKNELAPFADDWEEHGFPDSTFRRAGGRLLLLADTRRGADPRALRRAESGVCRPYRHGSSASERVWNGGPE